MPIGGEESIPLTYPADEDEVSVELNNEIVAPETGDEDRATETVPKTHVPG